LVVHNITTVQKLANVLEKSTLILSQCGIEEYDVSQIINAFNMKANEHSYEVNAYQKQTAPPVVVQSSTTRSENKMSHAPPLPCKSCIYCIFTYI
jgi:hypothetical protein